MHVDDAVTDAGVLAHTPRPGLNGSRLAIKRDGSKVVFEPAKITRAVRRCLVNSMQRPDDEQTQSIADAVTEAIDRILAHDPETSVEHVQDLVEQQLMALGEYDAAKSYILYRAERQRLRHEQPIDPEITAAFAGARTLFPGPNGDVQMVQAIDKFARYRYDLGRREVWPESVSRVDDYFQDTINSRYPGAVDALTWAELKESLLLLDASPSMRCVQMAGPALQRCNVGVFNCAFAFMDSPQAMAEELYILMQGTGMGFSVEHEHAVDKWPRIKKQRGGAVMDYVVEDTTEGWCNCVKDCVEIWINGGDVRPDVRNVRPKGTPLKTKGGRASGPGPLVELLAYARRRILARQGSRLTSIDIHDITCMIHRIVQMGGVRRASGISLSDLDDMDMRNAKSGQFWDEHQHRNQANNSAVYEERPNAIQFMEEWLALAKSGSGERGIFNRGSLYKQLPIRRDRHHFFGTNPCGEIFLRDGQFCNLSIARARQYDTAAELCRKVVLASIWGTLQSTMTNFNYLSAKWKRNCDDERLLGVDILGHMDCNLLRPGAPGREPLMRQLRDLAVKTNAQWAEKLGINASAAVTCGKPSGDSSVFFDTAAGFKPHHGKHYIRRLRMQSDMPVAKFLQAEGVPCAEDYDKAGMLVFDFPCLAPSDNPIVLGQQTALEQLENWRAWKKNFTEHNPSVSIYVKDDEWLAVGQWVHANWDDIGGLSFFPFDGGVYPLAPYETIDEAEYNRRKATFPEIDWAKLVRYESGDMTIMGQQLACSSGACEVA